MLVSQPPSKNLQWWHEWESSEHRKIEGYTQYHLLSSGGHQQVLSDITTIGALWDMLESRLLRGCTVQVTFFPCGGSAEDDPTVRGGIFLGESQRFKIEETQHIGPPESSAVVVSGLAWSRSCNVSEIQCTK